MENKFEKDFIDLFRSKIYQRCKILVNDMRPVVTQVKLFVDNILLSPEKGDGSYTYRISNIVDLIVDIENNKLKNHEWLLCTNQDVNNTLITFDIDNVNTVFSGNKKEFKKLMEDSSIENYPKELFGKGLVCLIECVEDILNGEEIKEDVEIFELFKIGNNGENNVII